MNAFLSSNCGDRDIKSNVELIYKTFSIRTDAPSSLAVLVRIFLLAYFAAGDTVVIIGHHKLYPDRWKDRSSVLERGYGTEGSDKLNSHEENNIHSYPRLLDGVHLLRKYHLQ